MILTTPDQISYYQLAVWKQAVILESKGMKHSSGKAIRPRIAVFVGLKPRDTYSAFEIRIRGMMQEMIEAQKQAVAQETSWAAYKAEEQDYRDRANDHE